MFLYLIYNLANHKVYVGKTEKSLISRWQRHLGYARLGSPFFLHRAIRKYGEDSFIMLKLDIAQSAEELNKKEINMISELCAQNPKFGYNMTAGGEGQIGWIPSTQTRIKMRIARQQYRQSPETIAKAANSRRGQKRSSEICIKIGNSHRGMKHSAGAKEKMRIAKLGIKRPPRSLEYCVNISIAKIGHIVSAETRAKISTTLKLRNQKPAEKAVGE